MVFCLYLQKLAPTGKNFLLYHASFSTIRAKPFIRTLHLRPTPPQFQPQTAKASSIVQTIKTHENQMKQFEIQRETNNSKTDDNSARLKSNYTRPFSNL